MRRKWLLAAAAVLLTTGAVPAAGERVVLEGALVRVNDRIVTVSDFAERLQQELTQIPNPPAGEELQEFAEMLLGEIVNELLLMERASEKHVVVEDGMIDGAITNLREENNLQEDEAWKQALESSGITLEQLRERYRRTIMLQRTVQSEVRPVEITEEELRRQYERDKEMYRVPPKVELEQLFFQESVGDSDRDQLLQRARGLVERVRDGADLQAEATLAGVEIQELGEIPVEDCRPDLTEALQGLEDGGLAGPLLVPGGVQVIRLVEKIPEGYQPFDEVVMEIRRQKSAETYEGQTRGLVERLKQEYLVEVNQEHLAMILDDLGGA